MCSDKRILLTIVLYHDY